MEKNALGLKRALTGQETPSAKKALLLRLCAHLQQHQQQRRCSSSNDAAAAAGAAPARTSAPDAGAGTI